MPKYRTSIKAPEWSSLNWAVHTSEANIFLAAFRYRVDAEKFASGFEENEVEVIKI